MPPTGTQIAKTTATGHVRDRAGRVESPAPAQARTASPLGLHELTIGYGQHRKARRERYGHDVEPQEWKRLTRGIAVRLEREHPTERKIGTISICQLGRRQRRYPAHIAIGINAGASRDICTTAYQTPIPKVAGPLPPSC